MPLELEGNHNIVLNAEAYCNNTSNTLSFPKKDLNEDVGNNSSSCPITYLLFTPC